VPASWPMVGGDARWTAAPWTHDVFASQWSPPSAAAEALAVGEDVPLGFAGSETGAGLRITSAGVHGLVGGGYQHDGRQGHWPSDVRSSRRALASARAGVASEQDVPPGFAGLEQVPGWGSQCRRHEPLVGGWCR